MPSAADRIEFTPPPPGGLLRAVSLAVAAHLALLAALTYGLQWKREQQNVAAEAELWAAVPREAAPREVAPPPPAPQPEVRTPPPPPPPAPREADIALEREKQKLAAQRKREEAEARRKEQAKLAAEAKRLEEERKRLAQEANERKLAQLREENLKRMQGMAGASGSQDARGSAAQSAGPSASWAGRVQARVRPNIVFGDDAPGNPKAEVEVRSAPDGTIVGKRLVKSSGVTAWDDAVLRALDKTEALPRDVDGRVPSPVVIEFRPRG